MERFASAQCQALVIIPEWRTGKLRARVGFQLFSERRPGTDAVFVSPKPGSIYPFPSARSTCRVPGKRCWPASRCKPPFTSTTTTSQTALILKVTAQRKRPGPWVGGTRRRNVAQGHRAEPSQYTELEEGVAPSARGSSPMATLRGAARALHPNEWGLSPSANPLSLRLLLLLGTRTLRPLLGVQRPGAASGGLCAAGRAQLLLLPLGLISQ